MGNSSFWFVCFVTKGTKVKIVKFGLYLTGHTLRCKKLKWSRNSHAILFLVSTEDRELWSRPSWEWGCWGWPSTAALSSLFLYGPFLFTFPSLFPLLSPFLICLSSSFHYSLFSLTICRRLKLASRPTGWSRASEGSLKNRLRSRNPPENARADERNIQWGGPCKVTKGARDGQYFSLIIFSFSLILKAMKRK